MPHLKKAGSNHLPPNRRRIPRKPVSTIEYVAPPVHRNVLWHTAYPANFVESWVKWPLASVSGNHILSPTRWVCPPLPPLPPLPPYGSNYSPVPSSRVMKASHSASDPTADLTSVLNISSFATATPPVRPTAMPALSVLLPHMMSCSFL